MKPSVPAYSSLGDSGQGGAASSVAFPNADRTAFRRYVATDPLLGGIPAFRYLVPKDWICSGSVQWNPALRDLPAQLTFEASSPDGRLGFTQHPVLCFSWLKYGVNPFMAGLTQDQYGHYFHWGREIYALVDPESAIRDFVMPRLCDFPSAARLVSFEPAPELERYGKLSVGFEELAGAGFDVQLSASRARIHFELDGRPVEEVIEAYVYARSTGIFCTWDVASFSYRADRGDYDRQRWLFAEILASFQADIAWQDRQWKIAHMLLNSSNEQLGSVRELNRFVTQRTSALSKNVLESYEQRQRQAALEARMPHGDYIRSVEHYRDNEGRDFELPSGYEHAWENDRGEIVLSKTGDYYPDPAHEGGPWRELAKK